MKIPKKIKLIGAEITVQYVNQVDEKDNLGVSKLNENIILIKKGLDKQTEEITFLHELFHFIHWYMSHEELIYDENVNDRLAHAMYQILPQIGVVK